MNDPRVILPPQNEAYPPYVWFPKVLSPPECDALSQIAEQKALGKGTIGNGDNSGGHVDEGYRNVETCGLTLSDGVSGASLEWLFLRVRDKVQWANDRHFHFSLHGLYENINFLKYTHREGEVGGYKWHQDYGGGLSSCRKLSAVIQLSRPDEYTGCRLRLFTNMDFDPGHVEQGDMIVFPSWASHCVTPIESGTRKALVSWVTGEPFR